MNGVCWRNIRFKVCHHKTGLLVPPGDKQALAKAFTDLIENPDLRKSLGTFGRQWVGKYRWDKSVDMLFGHDDLVIEW